jgi:hypothetical protein
MGVTKRETVNERERKSHEYNYGRSLCLGRFDQGLMTNLKCEEEIGF